MATTFSPSSLRFSQIPPASLFKFTHISSPSSTNFNFPRNPCRRLVLRAAVSTRVARKISDSGEAEELVRTLLRNLNRDKKPLMSTLNKYVKVVRSEHCFLLFEELGKIDKWLLCLEVFRWMQKQRWYIADNGVYSKLISLMGKKGQTRMALWLFSEMRKSGCRPDTSVYNALMTAHLHTRDKARALDKSLEYFEKMKGMERCKPNIVTYNILLRASAQARNVAQVETLFKNLEESEIAPDIFTFNGVMAAYGKHGMIREMEVILARLKSNKLKPDIITFNLLIDSYGKKQEFEKMEQVFKSLVGSKEKPTLPTFNSMITNYGKARQREKAELTFEKMKEMGYTPSVITYECLIIMYGCCDCVSKAREIFDKMVESEPLMKASTLNSMLEAYFRNGLPLEADTLFETAHSSKMFRLDTSTYKLLYKAYTKAKKKELLDKLLKHMDREGIVLNKKFFLDALEKVGPTRSKSTSVSTNSRPNNSPANAFVSINNRSNNRPANAFASTKNKPNNKPDNPSVSTKNRSSNTPANAAKI